MTDFLRHLLGFPCRRFVTGHRFEPLSWDETSGFTPDPKPYRNRCMLPLRCHER